MKEDIQQIFAQHHQVQQSSLAQLEDRIIAAAKQLTDCLESGGKILLCGNGGSAADAQHFAAELVNRFLTDRNAYAAIALTTDSSIITAIANDDSYENIFARQIEALGKPGDCLIAITTSGNSINLLPAIHQAYRNQMRVLVLSGKDGGKLAPQLQQDSLELRVPSFDTPRIQEAHLVIIHCLCYLIEKQLYPVG